MTLPFPRTLADAIAEGQATYHADRAFRVCVNPSTGAHDALCIRSRVPSNLTLLGHVVLRSEDNAWQDAPGNPSRLLPDTPAPPALSEAAAAARERERERERRSLAPPAPPRPLAGQPLAPAERRVADLAAQGCTFEDALIQTGCTRQSLTNYCSLVRLKLDLPAPRRRVRQGAPGSTWGILCAALRR